MLLFILPTDHCLGRLRPHGSQIFHGSGPDTFRRTGTVQYGHWVVQTLPSLLPGGPHLGTSDKKGFPVISGKFHWTFLLSLIATVKLLSPLPATHTHRRKRTGRKPWQHCMLNVVSSEPTSRAIKRPCVLRGSRPHCALAKALRWRSRAVKNCRVWSSVTLEIQSNLKPWINLKESVSPFQWHLYIFIVFLRFSDPKACYATEMELYSH